MTDEWLTPQQRVLSALDRLTKPSTVAVWQDERLIRRTDPPLLDWLRESVANNIGGRGSGKLARERVPIDFSALTVFESIDGGVRSWLDELGARPGKDVTLSQMLRSWYVLWSAQNHTDGITRHYLAVMEGWESRIMDVIDPPKKIELTTPCPLCGQEYINIGLKLEDGSDDPDDVERVRVLVVIERDNINESYAMCRACDKVWLGVGPMRQLRIAMDDAEIARMSEVDESVVA